jgi:hypothetical protein
MAGSDAKPGLTVLERCFGCRNRTSLVDAIVLECGLLCCRRCAERREVLTAKSGKSVEIIG